ncbi:DUF4082 domain-containing protein [Candidatus Uhrbacteria bacterium]|nr:DUF4082 domain-containing protein [Candidatus Uhrbacteria bacterium]
MALQSLGGGGVLWPDGLFDNNGLANRTLDADDESFGGVYWNPIARQVKGFSAFVAAVTASGNVRFSLETVAAELPSGTLVDAAATVDVNVSGTGIVAAEFSAAFTLPVGTYAARIKRPSGSSFVGSFAHIGAAVRERSVPYSFDLTGGTVFVARYPACGFLFAGSPASETYLRIPFGLPASNNEAFVIPNGSGVEVGGSVVLPFRASALGICLRSRRTAGGDPKPEVVLYDTDGTTQLASATFDPEISSTTLARTFAFSTPVELAPGTYYLALRSNAGSAFPELRTWTVTDIKYLDSAGFGRTLTRTSSSDPWSNHGTTGAPQMALVLDQLDDGKAARAQTIMGVI